MRPNCSIEGCFSPHHGRGLCHPHYERWRLTGNPLPPVRYGGPPCPTCGTRNVVAYYAIDGVILEWRCMDIAHEPDTFLGRNFVLA